MVELYGRYRPREDLSEVLERNKTRQAVKRAIDTITPQDVQKRAESAIAQLTDEIASAQERIAAAKKELEYWKRVAGK